MPKSLFKRHAIVVLLLSALVAAAYASTLRIPFLQDDYAFVFLVVPPEGAHIFGEFYRDFILGEFYREFHSGVYRPLHWLPFAIEYPLYGTNPLGYRLTNLVLNLINSFFVYLLALELLPAAKRRWGVAVAAGAIFALYPTSPGAITYITGRVDAVCAVFLLPALLFFLRWLRTERRLYLAVSVGLYFPALLSKETAIVLPGMLFLCALYKGRGFKGAALTAVPFAVALGVYLAIRQYFVAGADADFVSSMPLDVLSSLRGFFFWTLQMFVPLNLNLLPLSWQGFLNAILSFLFWPMMVLVVLGTAAYYYFGKAKEKLPVLLFALYALPVALVFRMLVPATETELISYDPSRWFYIPSAFMSIFIAYMLWAAFAEHRRLFLAATTVVCACFLAILVANNSVYVEAGERVSESLETGKKPEFPDDDYYKGISAFGWEGNWDLANHPMFKDVNAR